MTGGENSGDNSDNVSTKDTTILVDLNGFTSGVNLLWEFYGHCVTTLNTSHSIMVGGVPNPTRSLIFNSNTFEMTRGPDLAGSGRSYHTCSHIRHDNGSNYVIVSGGTINGEWLSTSEILDADNASSGWTPGK